MDVAALGPAVLGAPGPRFSDVLALVFLGNGCPTARACEDALIELQTTHGPQGFGLVAINPNNPYLSPLDTVAQMGRRARDKGYNFPYLKDVDAALARAYGMVRTPQCCVLDRDRVLRYRGRVFDSRDPARVQRRDLQEAVEDLLGQREVRVPETDSFGCSIVW